ncbi:hypothetical protein FA13DRAFT_1800136 [Coprinellus micaceus]|uniref:Uncharacterized protein n=1 Tax=Coprinellus micaceus TaxID=71717 RepID=A0A4Y7SHL6_COPMI|nr:hypothetical protein FA13DRAFT_1800136 [Coprinellus micaceus]
MLRSLQATLTRNLVRSQETTLAGGIHFFVVARPHTRHTRSEELPAERVGIFCHEVESIVYLLSSRVELTSPGGVGSSEDLRVVANLPPRISSPSPFSCSSYAYYTPLNTRRQSLMTTRYTLDNLILVDSHSEKCQEGPRKEWFWYWRNTSPTRFGDRAYFTRQDGDVAIVDEYAHRVLRKLQVETMRLKATERGLSMSEILAAVKREYLPANEDEEGGRLVITKAVGGGFVKDYRRWYPVARGY